MFRQTLLALAVGLLVSTANGRLEAQQDCDNAMLTGGEVAQQSGDSVVSQNGSPAENLVNDQLDMLEGPFPFLRLITYWFIALYENLSGEDINQDGEIGAPFFGGDSDAPPVEPEDPNPEEPTDPTQEGDEVAGDDQPAPQATRRSFRLKRRN